MVNFTIQLRPDILNVMESRELQSNMICMYIMCRVHVCNDYSVLLEQARDRTRPILHIYPVDRVHVHCDQLELQQVEGRT